MAAGRPADLHAQSLSIGKIKKDNAFISFEAEGKTAAQADSAAVAGLAGNIAEIAGFTGRQIEVKDRLMLGYLDEIRKRSDILYKGKTTALRYISRNSIPDIFETRREKIRQMLSIADKAAKDRQADVALRYWSWAEELMKSVPPLDSERISDTDAKKRDLLGRLHVKFTSPDKYDKNIIELEFTMGGKPVQSVDYRFFDGKNWSGILSAKDGKGFARVPASTSPSDYRVKYEIKADHLQHIWREIQQIGKAYGPTMKKDEVNASRPTGQAAAATAGNVSKIDFSEIKRKIMDVIAMEDEVEHDSSALELAPLFSTDGYDEIVARVCKALTEKDFASAEALFTPEGYGLFKKLLEYGNARLLNPRKIFYYRLGDEVFARSIPMVFSFPHNDREFVEDIVLTFDADKRISNLTFALGRSTAEDIASHTGWPEEARIILMNFLENYKTAYALKRLDYIGSIFDEDALIITGRVLKNAGKANEFGAGKYVSLTRQSKGEYMKRLGQVFASQEFINIQFTDCEVMKLGKAPALYGIKIRQEYFSTTYSDTGYLFVLVDLHDPGSPVIHVRTWQEAPDKDFGVIGPYNF